MWVDHVLYTCFSWLHTLEEASRTQALAATWGNPLAAGVGPSGLRWVFWG